MPRLIQDQFTNLQVSRQRRYQLRREAEGRCRLCGEPVVEGSRYCLEHRDGQRRRARKVVTKVEDFSDII